MFHHTVAALLFSILSVGASAASFPVLECSSKNFHIRSEITRDDGGETVLASGTVATQLGMPVTPRWRKGVSDRTRANEVKDADFLVLRSFFGTRVNEWRQYSFVFYLEGSRFPFADQNLILPVKPSSYLRKGPFTAALLHLPEMANPYWEPMVCEILSRI